MLKTFLEKVDELYTIINLPIQNEYKKIAVEKYKKYPNIGNSTFSSKYIDILHKEKGKNHGVVYTPNEISNYMLDDIVKKEDLIRNAFVKILDPACGCGDILISCYRRLKTFYLENLEEINKSNGINLKTNDIPRHIIDNNLYGFDIDNVALKILCIDLFSLSGYWNITNFSNKDFLMDEAKDKYDVIIGNPPYIGHKAVGSEYSKKLKTKFQKIYKDKGDISYCFFEEALKCLKKGGKLAYISSRYFMESPSGEELRKLLKEKCSINKIVDFYGIRPFKRAGIDPVIIFLSNEDIDSKDIEIIKPINCNSNYKDSFYKSLLLKKGNDYKRFYMGKNLLNDSGWILLDEKERKILEKIKLKSSVCLYDICDSYQGIITGCDNAFVVNKNTIDEEKLEKNIIKPWIKNSHIRKNAIKHDDMYLIYSDSIKNIEEYPNAINHIAKEKDKLMNRRECKSGVRKWYELQWGRKKEIFDGEKIVFPYKASGNRFALDKGSYFSADVYSLILKENTHFTYKYLISLLNSSVYEFYIKSYVKKLGNDLYEYYPNNIMKLRLPYMWENDNLSEKDIYEFFDLKKEEINLIERYIKKDI